MEDFASELEVVFADRFDRNACLALRKTTANIANGKKRVVKSALQAFGYSSICREKLQRQMVSGLPGITAYHFKESPWLEAELPSESAMTNLKSSLMATSPYCRDFILLINEDPRRIAWQWADYWKVLMYSFPKEGYVNSR